MYHIADTYQIVRSNELPKGAARGEEVHKKPATRHLDQEYSRVLY